MDKTRILIVEDEIVIATDLSDILKKRGYQVVDIATKRDDALRLAGELRPDLVIMDIKLQGGDDGIETAQSIYTDFGIPFIYITAHVDKDTVRRATESASYGYIIKPYNQDSIFAAVEMALNKSRLEKKISESELKYRSLFETMIDGYSINGIVYDGKGRLKDFNAVEMNPSMRKITGNAVRMDIDFLADSFSRSRDYWLGILDRVVRKGESLSLEEYSNSLSKWFHISLFSTNEKQFSLLLRDVTKRKIIEEEIKRRNEELRSLAAYMESIREEERTRIAREIHDYLGQSLTALRIDCSWIKTNLDDRASSRTSLQEKIARMIDIIDETLDSVRNICAELRPGILDHLGLVSAIEWLCRETEKRTGIHCVTRFRPREITVNDDIAVTFFRIFQEMITNVVRHAKAKNVEVSLMKIGRELVLDVSDDGIGISDEKINAPRSLGLIGMRERASHHGGILIIKGEKDTGTEMTLTITL